MPYRMHSEYLRRLFLNNDLAEGRFTVADKPIALTDIHAPIFTVGTLRDHVAPWRSTYKINLLTDTDVTYLLTVGGHNAGIVSEPGHDGRSFQIMTKPANAPLRRSGNLPGHGAAQGRFVVAGMGGVAQRTLGRPRRSAATWVPPRRALPRSATRPEAMCCNS